MFVYCSLIAHSNLALAGFMLVSKMIRKRLWFLHLPTEVSIFYDVQRTVARKNYLGSKIEYSALDNFDAMSIFMLFWASNLLVI